MWLGTRMPWSAVMAIPATVWAYYEALHELGQIGFQADNLVPWYLRVLVWRGTKGKKPKYDDQFQAVAAMRGGGKRNMRDVFANIFRRG